ncbi:hypothetical protein CLU79DRAFT_752720 [Phycomyces nitens]|nr:hypothetical protein CLU79DRAFT_752720 [Phycomyces nitens]
MSKAGHTCFGSFDSIESSPTKLVIMSSRLPFEILGIVASYLPTKDKISCTTVCKLWSAPFQNSLWTTMNINKRTLKKICNISHDEPNVFQTHGDRVQTINIQQLADVKDDQLYCLQQCFQQIRHLRVLRNGLFDNVFGDTPGWNLWANLVDLCISLPHVNNGDQKDGFYRILACLPHLRHLHVTSGAYMCKTVYSWRDLERVHALLPHLETLDLYFIFENVPLEDTQEVLSVIAAKKLTRAVLYCANFSVGWLLYYASKYPNVHTYELTFGIGPVFESSLQVPEGLDEIKYSFPSLRVATVSHNTVYLHLYHVFWRVFGPFLEPLQSLDYRLNVLKIQFQSENVDNVDNEFILSSKTLQKLFIKVRLPGRIKDAFPLKLDYCPCLVDLTLEIPKLVVETDMILKNCISLKKIKLKGNRITLSPAASTTSEKHGLEKIEIWDSDIDPIVLNYISFRCDQLCEMGLHVARITAPGYSEATSVLLDMSFTHFKVLKLCNVVFRVLDGEIEDLSGPKSNTNIHLLVVERTQSVPDPDEASPVLDTPLIFQDNYANQMWFQHCLRRVNRRLYSEVRILNKQQVDFAQNYFKTIVPNERICEPAKSRCFNGFMDKQSWKDDLSRGYVLLRCRYVGRYEIDEVIYDHDAKAAL